MHFCTPSKLIFFATVCTFGSPQTAAATNADTQPSEITEISTDLARTDASPSIGAADFTLTEGPWHKWLVTINVSDPGPIGYGTGDTGFEPNYYFFKAKDGRASISGHFDNKEPGVKVFWNYLNLKTDAGSSVQLQVGVRFIWYLNDWELHCRFNWDEWFWATGSNISNHGWGQNCTVNPKGYEKYRDPLFPGLYRLFINNVP